MNWSNKLSCPCPSSLLSILLKQCHRQACTKTDGNKILHSYCWICTHTHHLKYVLVLQLACTRGFIYSALLQKRAEKITIAINTIPAMNVHNNGLQVFNADYKFTCNGVLISLLLGGDVRSTGTSTQRYKYGGLFSRFNTHQGCQTRDQTGCRRF